MRLLLPSLLVVAAALLTGVTWTKAAARPSLQPMSRMSEAMWAKRHQKINAAARRQDAELLFIGDSITQGYENTRLWKERFAPRSVNAGIASDRVEHMLWRVRHGNLGKLKPKAVVLLGGVNNMAVSSPTTIAAHMAAVIDAVHDQSPQSIILLHAVFPSGERPTSPRRTKIHAINAELAKLADGERVLFVDLTRSFLLPDGTLPRSIAHDQLHLTAKGYEIWANALDRRLRNIN
jgi:lysophospholipase L1-like esterase